MARPSILAALLLLLTPIAILTAGRSPHASAANTITVNSLTDPGLTGDHFCSLREAITNANAKADTSMGDCAAGTGNDTIVFNLSGTIALVGNLPSIQHTLEIDGTGQTITIDGGGGRQGFLNFSGVVTLNNLTIANGHSSGNGGGVANNGSLTVTNCTFVGNTAAGGGAIYNGAPAGTLAVTNSTFSGNVSAAGGAIESGHGGTVTSSTFANNSSGSSSAGAAILATDTTVQVANSILAGSTGANCGVVGTGVVGNGGFNISDDGSCGFGSSPGANGDTLGDNVLPLLDTGGLQNNGGPTDTIGLQPTSPAVNAVPIADCPATDQRGDPRPDPGDKSNACDVGAFESIDALGTPTPTATATATPTASATSTATVAPSSSATPTATATDTTVATATATATATVSGTATVTATATDTPSATPTTTATSTLTSTPTVTATGTPTTTATATVSATATDTATATATVSATATDTGTATATATATITATGTPTATATATDTPTATATITVTPTATATPKPPPVKLTITPASLSFGTVKTGGAPIKSITLHNKSKTNDSVTVPQVSGQYFSLASNDCEAGVPAGGTCKIGVSFAPMTAGKKFTGKLTFTDQSKQSSHTIKLKGKGVSTPASSPTMTPSVTATPTATATATATSTGGGTPTATATATPSPTGTSTATYTLSNISQTLSGFVDLTEPSISPNPVQTATAVAVATPSFTDSISLSDTNVDISGSASASQTSAADGSSISAIESAQTAADLSLCLGPNPLCMAENQGFTEFLADFCIASDTTYALSGSVQASTSEDFGNINATGIVSIEDLTTMDFVVNEQVTNGQNDPLSIDLPLSGGGCYEMIVEVYATALPSGTGSGSASASCNVLLSPQ